MYINRKKIAEIMDSDEVLPLENESEIEDLIVTINGLNQKIDFLNKLKSNRVKTINEEIEKNEYRKNKLHEIIISTLKKIDMKSLSFPGIGKVITKNPKGKWIINDEEKLISVLKTELSANDFESIVPTKPSIAKKELNKILDVWEKSGKLPDVVEREESKISLTVTIDKDIKSKEFDDDEEEEKEEDNGQTNSLDITDKGYDSLEI